MYFLALTHIKFPLHLNRMILAKVASWVSMIWVVCPLSRFGREVLLRILFENPLELRTAMLNYQIKQMMLKYI
jgi:hypothetical protein